MWRIVGTDTMHSMAHGTVITSIPAIPGRGLPEDHITYSNKNVRQRKCQRSIGRRTEEGTALLGLRRNPGHLSCQVISKDSPGFRRDFWELR